MNSITIRPGNWFGKGVPTTTLDLDNTATLENAFSSKTMSFTPEEAAALYNALGPWLREQQRNGWVIKLHDQL